MYENWLISMGTKGMQYRSQQKGILCPLCQQSIGIMMMSWVEKDVDQWEFTYTLLQAIQFITIIIHFDSHSYTVWEIHYKQTQTHMYSSARVSMAELCIFKKKKNYQEKILTQILHNYKYDYTKQPGWILRTPYQGVGLKECYFSPNPISWD